MNKTGLEGYHSRNWWWDQDSKPISPTPKYLMLNYSALTCLFIHLSNKHLLNIFCAIHYLNTGHS